MSSLIETIEFLRKSFSNDENKLSVHELLNKLNYLVKNRKVSLNIAEENVIIETVTQCDATDVENLEKNLKIVINLFDQKVVWIPETDNASIYSYYTGNSPWSLTLASENWEEATNRILEELMVDYENGEIEMFFEEFLVGDSVLFLRNEKLYRGIITSIEEESLGIFNIDNGHTLFCDKSMMFYPTIISKYQPGQALNCCIINSSEFDESVWSTELQNILKPILLDYKFRLTNWVKDSSAPPKFMARLIGINHLNEEVDLTELLENDILKPWISEGLPSGITAGKFFSNRFRDIFEKQDFSSQGNSCAFGERLNDVNEASCVIDDLSALDVQALEIATNTELALEYQAQDYKHVCNQYRLFGLCTKVNCDKLHKKPNEELWTEDKISVYTNAFNVQELPDCNDIIKITILDVLSANSCYAMLPNSYFYVNGEKITLFQEMERINKPANIKAYKCLTTDPNLGEIVLAFCSDKKFYRARIIDLCDKGFNIFKVDYGKVEIVTFENLRKIENRFMHYPFQAITVNLYGIVCKNEIKGKEVLNDAVGLTFEAVVMGRDEGRELISAIIHLNKYLTTFNEFLIQLGHYENINLI